MKETKQERFFAQKGNAMIYVLVVIALFAALSFIMSRQTDSGEASTLTDQQVDFAATQILQTSMQVKQAADAMIFGGTPVSAIDFTGPGDAAFDTPPNKDKIFHPDGGGVILSALPDGSALSGVSDPAPGWYLGRFNAVEWTPGAGDDVLLTAYGISKAVCARVNERLTGDAAIPVATAALRNLLVDDAHHAGANAPFTAATCAACDGKPSLCVEDPGHAVWAFYSLIEAQ